MAEFVPSLCNSAYGLNRALWATVQHPLETTAQFFAEASHKMGECMADFQTNSEGNPLKFLNGYVKQVNTLCDNFGQLSPLERGELMGYVIGKHGVDFFAGGASLKAIVTYRNLKRANSICNLEAMITSNANKKAIRKAALQHSAERKSYLNSVEIQWDKQNKHIPGKHNYIPEKGKICLESDELEFLVKKHVGTGQRVVGEFGEAGFKERIDFGKIIGEYALKEAGQPIRYLPTTKGMIHYAKDGLVHVVPSNPRAVIL